MTTEHNEQASYTAADMADQGAAQFRAGYAAAKAEQSAAAPGIDLAPIKLLALKWRYMEGGYGSMASQNRRDAFNRCANDLEKALKLIDASPEGGSDTRDGERYRWLLRNYLSFDVCDEARKCGNLDAAIDAAMNRTGNRSTT